MISPMSERYPHGLPAAKSLVKDSIARPGLFLLWEKDIFAQ
jgi:hypothetical protein